MNSPRTILVLVTLLCLAQTAVAQSPDWLWARNSGSVSNDYSNAVCTDADGNVYITGTFQGSTITFGSYVLQNTTEGFLDFFIAKYDSQGNVIWAVSDGGAEDDYAYGICIDLTGNVFITGYYGSPSLTIGPSTMNSTSVFSVFVAKYDSNGIALWGRSGDASTDDAGYSYGIGSDAFGNIYITGSYGYNAEISFGSHTLQSYGGYDMFLVKYDNDGNVLWANHMGGAQVDYSRAIHVSPDGTVHITGFFVNEADFGSGTVVSANPAAYMEVCVAKYNTNGANIWANYALVPSTGNYASGTGITADLSGSVYITGYYQQSISFGSDTITNAGNHGIFLAKYTSDGIPLWGKSPGGTGTNFGWAVSTEPEGNVLLTGYFESSFLNFGGYPVINANVGFNDAFIARYDPDGNALGAVSIGGPGSEYGMAVASSPEGDVFSTGYFGSYSLDFSGNVITNNGSYDAFLAKMSRDALNSVPTAEGHADVRVFPNPTSDQIHVLSNGHSEITVYDLAARRILRRQFTNRVTIDLTELPAGLYLYELMRDGTVVKGKFIRE